MFNRVNRCNGHTRRDEARYRVFDDGALGVPAGIEKERAEPVAHRRRDGFHVPAGSVLVMVFFNEENLTLDLWQAQRLQPLRQNLIEVLRHRTSGQTRVRELVCVAPQTPVAACVLTTTAVAFDTASSLLQALAEHAFLFESRDQASAARDVVVEDDLGDLGACLTLFDCDAEIRARNFDCLSSTFQ